MKNIFNYIIYLLIPISLMNSHTNMSNKKINYKLYIPKINIERNIYDFNNINNDVNKNVYLATKYNFSTLNGSIVLAAHSGNSLVSYFDNLNKLDIMDEVIIEDLDNIYTYIIDDTFFINKNGTFNYNDKDRYIYLITCVKNNHKQQLVYGGKLKKITKKSTFS